MNAADREEIERARRLLAIAQDALQTAGGVLLALQQGAEDPVPPAPVPVPPPPPPAEPPAPVPPPPPTPVGMLESTGSKLNTVDWATGRPVDMIDAARIPAPIPWPLFADQQQTLARSLEGTELASMTRWHVYGHDALLYEGTLRVHNGKVIRAYSNNGANPEVGAIRLRDKSKPTVHRPGVRGESIMSPYTTWHGHTRVDGSMVHTSPHLPMWIGITLHGVITYAFRDGSTADAFDLGLAADSWTNDFTFFDPDRKLFFVTDTPKGRILKVDRRTTPWSVSVLCDGLGQADSVRAVGDQLYVADSVGGQVWKIDATTGSKRVLGRLGGAFWVSYFSDGKLAVATKNRTVYEMDPDTGSVGGNLLRRAAPITSGQPWVMVDVDRNGTCGKRDALMAISVTGQANIDCYRVWRDGTPALPEFGKGISSVGPVMNVIDPWGHYPWVIAHHPDDACVMVQGMESISPQIIKCVHPDEMWGKAGAPWQPARPDFWTPERTLGLQTLRNGGAFNKPSFTSQMNSSGGGLFTADHLAELPFAEQCQWWLDGGIGSHPRTLSKAQVNGMVMFQARNSLRYLREGGKFIDDLAAYLKARP